MPGEYSPHLSSEEHEPSNVPTNKYEEDWVHDEVTPVRESVEQHRNNHSDLNTPGAGTEQHRGHPSYPCPSEASVGKLGSFPSGLQPSSLSSYTSQGSLSRPMMLLFDVDAEVMMCPEELRTISSFQMLGCTA